MGYLFKIREDKEKFIWEVSYMGNYYRNTLVCNGDRVCITRKSAIDLFFGKTIDLHKESLINRFNISQEIVLRLLLKFSFRTIPNRSSSIFSSYVLKLNSIKFTK